VFPIRKKNVLAHFSATPDFTHFRENKSEMLNKKAQNVMVCFLDSSELRVLLDKFIPLYKICFGAESYLL
jgi:hypothetical protein